MMRNKHSCLVQDIGIHRKNLNSGKGVSFMTKETLVADAGG
jgi:hypothetical protein